MRRREWQGIARRSPGLLAAAWALCSAPSASWAELDAKPMPRVETGGHTGSINKLSVDRAGSLLLTVSNDKTARLWDAGSGRLLHILRVPIENGHEGQLYAAALSPNGRIAAVGGYTGSFVGKSIIYFFDTASGHRRSQQSTFSDAAVENLAFSDDGKVLAVCLADGRGVRIYSLERQELMKSEDGTHDKILGAAFARNGDLAVTTLDGLLWLFRASAQYGATSVHLTGGRRPMHVQFSPEGTELAVGFDGDPSFSIVDSQSLKETFVGKLPEAAGQRGLHVVEWSADGDSLYAGGETVVGIDAPMYRFTHRGRGDASKVLASTRRITDIRRLPQNAMAFTSAEPEVGVLEAGGRVRWRYRAPTMDTRRMAADFRVSPAANSVTLGTPERTGAFTFDVLQTSESALKRTSLPTPDRAPARESPPDWTIDVSEDKEHLSVNGTDVPLENRESVLNWTFTSKGKDLIVGTSWSLRSYDRTGKLLWVSQLSSSVNLARVSDDGRAIVTALSDGSIRWFRPEDGKEFLALFVNRNGQDWIAWIPPGYYMSSISGDAFIGWQINRGLERDPDFYRAIQFERILFRPDLVQAYFRDRGRPSNSQSLKEDSFGIATLNAILPPRIDITIGPTVMKSNERLTNVRVSAESNSLPMQDWSLFVNGIPAVAGQLLGPSEKLAFSKEVEVRLPTGLSRLQVESVVASPQGRSMGVGEQYVNNTAGDLSARRGILYVLAIGVSQFTDTAIHGLRYAASDAAEIAKTFGQLFAQAGFSSIQAKLLVDSDATGANVASVLRGFLAPARGDDTVIVFLASHGISDRLGNYFFVPSDGKMVDIKTLDVAPDRAPSLIRWDVFVDELRRTAGRRLLIVDTCSSGASGGNFDLHSLAKRSMSSNFALMAAAGTHEESQELASAQHGLFTYGLLRALKTGYDPNHDGVVSLAEAFEYAFDTVQDKRNRAVGLQTPQLNAPDVLLGMALAPGSESQGSGQVAALGIDDSAAHVTLKPPRFGCCASYQK